MQMTTLARAIAAALLFAPLLLEAQTRRRTARTTSAPPVRVVQRDSAAGVLASRRDSVSTRRDTLDAHARFGQLLAAINTIEVNTPRFLGITGLRPAHMDFEDVRNLLRGDAQRALEQAIGRNERRITAMRNALQNSMILRDALVTRGIPMSQVIAVDVSPDATNAVVYYRPQE
jgi:hypothetical protein